MFNQIIFACILVLVFMIPFEFDVRNLGANIPVINTNLEIILGITFAMWLIKKIASRKRPARLAVDLPVIIYLSCVFLSAVLSLYEPICGIKYVFKLLGGLSLFYIVIDLLKEKKQIRRILNTLLIAGLVVAGIGLIERIFIQNLQQPAPQSAEY